MSSTAISPEATASTKARHELFITRVFDAPRALVWKAWTDPKMMKRWFGPRQFKVEDLMADVRPGGRWSGRLHSENFDTGDGVPRTLDLGQSGVYRELVEPERLVYTFQWDEATGLGGQETVITITFEENEGKTTMKFHQAFFLMEADRDGHNRGWNSSFDKLEDVLTGREG